MEQLATVVLDPLHDFMVKEGRLVAPSSVEQMQDAFDAFAASDTASHLCLFLHGGLVDEAAGASVAHELVKTYAGAQAYPFFFIWNSGLRDALQSGTARYRDDRRFFNIMKRLTMIVGQRLDPVKSLDFVPALDLVTLAVAAAQINTTTADRIDLTPADIEAFVNTVRDNADVPTATGRPLPVEDRARIGQPLRSVVHRLRTKHGHGLYTTCVEEVLIMLGVDDRFAYPVWQTMKALVDKAFDDDAAAAGKAFIDRLLAVWAAKPDLRVTIMGHSAGAIYAQRFIEVLDERLGTDSAKRVELILFAPALSFVRMQAGLGALRSRVSALRIFSLSDPVESGYWQIEGVYDKSLLYIVSSLCEKDPDSDRPLVGMQRYWLDRATYATPDVQDGIALLEWNRVVWAKTPPGAPEGWRSQACRHGGIPKERATLASTAFVLQHGFGSVP